MSHFCLRRTGVGALTQEVGVGYRSLTSRWTVDWTSEYSLGLDFGTSVRWRPKDWESHTHSIMYVTTEDGSKSH